MSNQSPARLDVWLLGHIVPEKDREAILGDLAEEYALRRTAESSIAVSCWYWGQVCRSVPLFAWQQVRRRRWLATLGIALAVYVAAGLVEFVTTFALAGIAAPDTPAGQIVSVIIGLTTLAIGGYVAARIRPAASIALAVIAAVVVALLIVASGARVPVWYQLVFLAAGPLASLAGGRVRHRQPLFTIALLAVASASLASCTRPAGQSPQGDRTGDQLLEQITAVERSALDRWVRLDPDGYLGLFAPEATYFDPTTETRLDGLEAMRARLEPVRNMKPPFTDPRYEMNQPKVQRIGDVAILTFNLINYGRLPDKQERTLARWNSTEVYRQIDGQWKIVHSHWSFTKPDIKQPGQ